MCTLLMSPSCDFVAFIRVPLKPWEASSARDALAKAVYGRMFDYIVESVNKAIPFAHSVSYIGILDIAGFGMFTRNHPSLRSAFFSIQLSDLH